ALPPDLLQERRELAHHLPPVLRLVQVARPALALVQVDGVHRRMLRDQVVRAVLDDVADVRVRKAAAQRLERGQGVDHVADRAQPDEQDPQRLRRHAGFVLRMLIGAICGSRQLPSFTTKVSAKACWPDRQAWLTRSVNTIQAWNGLKRNSWWPSGVDWNAGVSFMKLWKRRIARSYGEESRNFAGGMTAASPFVTPVRSLSRTPSSMSDPPLPGRMPACAP